MEGLGREVGREARNRSEAGGLDHVAAGEGLHQAGFDFGEAVDRAALGRRGAGERAADAGDVFDDLFGAGDQTGFPRFAGEAVDADRLG
ncbi:hypothetical protein [Glycomyces artemisiae]|uniref:hypothetical protein n=1 Tax=Glycomyces artemisiae TaxID=1076443 RepID=UPI000D0767E9|nr:hypothetical protein [Glycomyces artemisiae]